MGEQRAPGFQGCRQTLNVSVLGALPGGGWDNLRNVELGLVLGRDYSQCLTTEDGEYLIPDRAQVVPRRESIVETRTELIDHRVNDTDTWAAPINAELSFLPDLNGKFSVDCQNVRKYSLEYQTVTTRGQIRHVIYSVKAPENPDFQPDFLRHLLTLSDHLENNQTREAKYLAEMLVLRYGTHVLTDVEAGAALVQEYQVRRELVDSEARDKVNITYAASALFFHAVNAGDGVSCRCRAGFSRTSGGTRWPPRCTATVACPSTRASPCRSGRRASATGWRPSVGRAPPCRCCSSWRRCPSSQRPGWRPRVRRVAVARALGHPPLLRCQHASRMLEAWGSRLRPPGQCGRWFLRRPLPRQLQLRRCLPGMRSRVRAACRSPLPGLSHPEPAHRQSLLPGQLHGQRPERRAEDVERGRS